MGSTHSSNINAVRTAKSERPCTLARDNPPATKLDKGQPEPSI